ncbi:ThiF family adenylyltransferase [Archangium gephyra]|uniref:HesA/MoeB/ThiF family protein n=1 Tax=Archangium gephyra TaxID=48 RepID=UPI0035D46296
MPESHVCPPWWERWAGWWEHQQLFLQAEDPAGRFDYEHAPHRARWRGRLAAAGRSWEVIIRWGPGTPYMAPAVEPVGCWSMVHQLRDRSMCLLKPEALSAGYTGVPDMGFWLKRAAGWFEGYVQERWAIEPELWPVVALGRPGAGHRVDLPPMRLMGLPPAWRQEAFERVGQFRALVSSNEGLSAVKEWRPGIKGPWRHWAEAENLVAGAREELQGIWLRPDVDMDPWSRRERFFADERLWRQYLHLSKQLSEKSNRKGRRCLMAFGWDFPGESDTSWFTDVFDPGSKLGPVRTIQDLGPNASAEEVRELLVDSIKNSFRRARQFLEMLMPWSGIVLDTRTLDARRRSGRPDAVHRRISSAQVLLVGLGALGSEVAHLLTQEGVGNFLLIDADLLMPGNVARHRANLADAGRPKVLAVQQDIQRINPSANVQVMENWIDEQLPKLGWTPQGPDVPFVAVGLTGDEASEHVLGELATLHRQHCIHAWMEMDGQVLRLFRVLSGKDPTLLELGRDPQSSIPPLPRSSGLAVRPRECAEAVLPGSAGNIHAAANFIARMVLDVIVGRQEDENHWLFAPDGVRDMEVNFSQLRVRYGVAGFRLSGAR